MDQENDMHYTAFAGDKRIASGTLAQVALKGKSILDAEPHAVVYIFDDTTGQTAEVDFRGSADEVRRRLERARNERAAAPAEARGPGRPKLGVVAREVTLLPRHWEWLATQPGGASVALRKLVEDAKRAAGGADRVRQSRETSLRFMSLMAGNRPGFEEATRALFAGQREQFMELSKPWPKDIRDHARALAQASFEAASGTSGKT